MPYSTNAYRLLVSAPSDLPEEDIRAAFGPQFLANLEKLIDATPGGRERAAAVRERMKAMRARFAEAQPKAAVQ